MKLKLLQFIIILFAISARAEAQNATLENRFVTFNFDPGKEPYEVIDRRDNTVCIEKAHAIYVLTINSEKTAEVSWSAAFEKGYLNQRD